jgi:hypothetical protein
MAENRENRKNRLPKSCSFRDFLRGSRYRPETSTRPSVLERRFPAIPSADLERATFSNSVLERRFSAIPSISKGGTHTLESVLERRFPAIPSSWDDIAKLHCSVLERRFPAIPSKVKLDPSEQIVYLNDDSRPGSIFIIATLGNARALGRRRPARLKGSLKRREGMASWILSWLRI